MMHRLSAPSSLPYHRVGLTDFGFDSVIYIARSGFEGVGAFASLVYLSRRLRCVCFFSRNVAKLKRRQTRVSLQSVNGTARFSRKTGETLLRSYDEIER